MRTFPVHSDGATAVESAPEEAGTRAAARAALEGRSRGLRAALPFLGPAFIASVAYIDPGNFATNIQGGSAYGYKLLWVVALANLMAMLLQTMSAKLGLATGKNLAELSREWFRPSVSRTMWIVSEIAAMATDLAEFLGASIGLQLIFHLPLLLAALITGAATYGILLLQGRGFRPLEAVITGLVGVIAVCYVIESVLSRPRWGQVVLHTTVPWLGGGQSVLFAVGIIGATVMPHVIFLHSSLTQHRIVPRSEAEARRIFRFTIPDVVLAMGLAGLINLSMLYMAAATFNAHGASNIADITTAYRTLTPLLGGGASLIFAISLLASGLSSSTVGTMAGQIIMQGFVGFNIPIWARRLITMLPALIVAAIGVDPTHTLVLSQVVLSFVLPVPVITLIFFARRRDLMGSLVNHRVTTALAVLCGALILVLNAVLLYQTFGGTLPGV
jgi:manganese transport protein